MKANMSRYPEGQSDRIVMRFFLGRSLIKTVMGVTGDPPAVGEKVSLVSVGGGPKDVPISNPAIVKAVYRSYAIHARSDEVVGLEIDVVMEDLQ